MGSGQGRPKVPGRFAFPGARNPRICSMSRSGNIFPAIFPGLSRSFPGEPPNRPGNSHSLLESSDIYVMISWTMVNGEFQKSAGGGAGRCWPAAPFRKTETKDLAGAYASTLARFASTCTSTHPRQHFLFPVLSAGISRQSAPAQGQQLQLKQTSDAATSLLRLCCRTSVCHSGIST